VIGVLFDVLLPIALVAAVGFVLRRALPLDLATLNRVVIYGFSPALIFVALVRADLDGSAMRMVFLSVALVAVMMGVTLACALPFGLRGADRSGLLLTTLFMNSGNYGLSAARFAFGEEGLTQALFFFVAQAIMAQTLGVGIAAAGGSRPGTSPLAEALRRIVRMPQIYAVIAALVARAAPIDLTLAGGVAGGVFRGVALLSEATLPLMLVILGMQLGAGVAIERPLLVALGSSLRLLVSPLLAYGLGLLIGVEGVALSVGVMLAGMPTAVNTTILAIEFGSRPTLVVGSVIVSSLASLVTLSLILSLLSG
jgi:predicted permease